MQVEYQQMSPELAQLVFSDDEHSITRLLSVKSAQEMLDQHQQMLGHVTDRFRLEYQVRKEWREDWVVGIKELKKAYTSKVDGQRCALELDLRRWDPKNRWLMMAKELLERARSDYFQHSANALRRVRKILDAFINSGDPTGRNPYGPKAKGHGRNQRGRRRSS